MRRAGVARNWPRAWGGARALAAPARDDAAAAGGALVPRRHEPDGLVARVSRTVIEGMHRLASLLATVRVESAAEAYTRRTLAARLALSSFDLAALEAARPSPLRLSVARQIDPVLRFLAAAGLDAGDCRRLVVAHPPVLAAAPEDLEALFSLLRRVRADPAAALRRHPALATLPAPAARRALRCMAHAGLGRYAAALLREDPGRFAAAAAGLERLVGAAPAVQGSTAWDVFRATRRGGGRGALAALAARRAGGAGGAAEALPPLEKEIAVDARPDASELAAVTRGVEAAVAGLLRRGAGGRPEAGVAYAEVLLSLRRAADAAALGGRAADDALLEALPGWRWDFAADAARHEAPAEGACTH